MNELNERLPNHAYPDPSMHHNFQHNYVDKYIRNTLNRSETSGISENFRFLLNRMQARPKFKLPKIKRKFLTRKQRKQAGLLKLPKTEWDYPALNVLHETWLQYMRENLGSTAVPKFHDPEWSNFSNVVYRSELIGAKIRIVRSQVPSQVDTRGILVWETKMTFQLVTEDSKLKTIMKKSSVFEFRVDNLKFTLFGKHLMSKPSDRSSKRLRSYMIPDID